MIVSYLGKRQEINTSPLIMISGAIASQDKPPSTQIIP